MVRLVCILIAFAIVGTYADEPERIVNGIPTTIEQHPFAISMRDAYNNHMCGGAIISDRFILTAGHCVQPILNNPGAIRVFTGTTYLNKGGVAHRVERMALHERYPKGVQGRPVGFDIGLIKLAEPIRFNNNQMPFNLPTSDLREGEDVTLVAWGRSGAGKPIHNDLQKLDAKSMLSNRCQWYHQGIMGIHNDEFCTLITKGTGTCNGDSGSAVIRKNSREIVGLVSGGLPCALGYPDVFTTVFRYRDWIRNKMASL